MKVLLLKEYFTDRLKPNRNYDTHKRTARKIVETYVKEKHNTDECIGFIDGINATIKLINKLTNS